MAKFIKANLAFGLLVFLILGGAYFYLFSNKSKSFQTENIRPTPTEVVAILEITPELTPTPTPSAELEETKPVSNTPSSVSGITRGQVICNYQIPPIPNQFGSANIESNWNNLVLSKTGSAKLAVCVSVNGASRLMSLDSRINGSRVDIAPWIALNALYVFTLYDDHGGDLGDCAGTVLSSCQINTVQPPTPRPSGH